MAIIWTTMEDIKRYIGSNEQTDNARKKTYFQPLGIGLR